MRVLLFCAMVATFLAPAIAQKNPSTPLPTGSVSGKVIFGDTQRPGRLVTVSLVRVPNPISGDTKLKEPPAPILLSTKTSLDGTFQLNAVPLGEYWAVAQSQGYILPIANLDSQDDLKSPTKIMAEFQTVLVSAEHPAEVTLSLQRGASVFGRLRFDDGAPIPGVTVSLVPEGKFDGTRGKLMVLGQLSQTRDFKTNDAGAYRISGIAPGKYRVVANVQVYGGSLVIGTSLYYSMGGGTEQWLPFYAPATVHRSESQLIEIKGSEEIPDADITVNLSSMHSVSGKVVSKEDQHLINGGTVRLKDPNDKDLDLKAIINADGTFLLPYVSEGNYDLLIQPEDFDPPQDAGQPWNRKTRQKYADSRMPLTVTNQDIIVPDTVAASKAAPQKTPDRAVKAEE